jgi:hypothetical protein
MSDKPKLTLAPVTVLPVSTKLDLRANRVLEAAIGKLDTALVIGYDNDDGRLYVASSTGDPAELLLLLERAKACVLSLAD